MENIGIISYGAYIPRLRIKSSDIAKAWGKDPQTITGGLGIIEKSKLFGIYPKKENIR